MGNSRLRQLSGLDESAYDLAVLALRAHGLVWPGPGREGSLRRIGLGDGPPPRSSTGAGARPGLGRARPPRARNSRSRPHRGESADAYVHSDEAVLRPEAGTQAQFKKLKPPKTYAYDSSLSPALEWTGKAERLSFDVPTLPLFVHERLSTRAIIQTLTEHRRDRQLEFQLFADPQLSLAQQLEAYEHTGGWVNRLILGDSLVVMNSLVEYEGLGGQVQMIYVDPPYAVNYKSNFQPFVRKTQVKDGDDASLTREPEMVRAYRDTWSLGLHSYLTYLRDRFLVARELLSPSGSIFVQINDERVHHVRELLDEVFGEENFVSQIVFQTTQGFETKTIATLGDFILWYARDKTTVKVNKLFIEQPTSPGSRNASWVLFPDGSYRGVRAAERRGEEAIPSDGRLYKPDNIVSQGAAAEPQPFTFQGKAYLPPANSHWKAGYPEGMQRLADTGRIHVAKNSIQYRRFADDFPFEELGNIWTDTSTGQYTTAKIYVVKTPTKAIERCVLMTTDPGDLVLDPTCGGGTTA